MKIKFLVDAGKELELIQKHVDMKIDNKLDPASVKLLENKSESLKKLNEIYKSKDFLDFCKKLESAWRKVEPRYFSAIKRITGHEWNLETYNCYITEYITGIADIPTRNSVAVAEKNYHRRKFSKLLLGQVIYILAHEIFHLHYMEIARETNSMDSLKLEAMETVPILVFFFDKEMKTVYNSVTLNRVRKSYPPVDKIFDDTLKIWKSRKSYADFMEKFLDFLKEGEK